MTNPTQVSEEAAEAEPKPSIRKPFGAAVKALAAQQAAHRKEAPRSSVWQTHHSRNRTHLRHLSLAYAFARGAVYAKVESAPKQGKREYASPRYILTILTQIMPAVVTDDTEKNIGKWLRGKYPSVEANE